MLTVSVIIPTKNAMPLIQEVMKSVLSQKCDFDYDVIVIDSGSKDKTVEYCKNLGKNVRVFQIKPEEFGHGKTRNQAINESDAEFCALLTHDAKPYDSNWLSNLVAPLQKDREVAGVFGRHIAYPNASPFTKKELNEHFDNLSTHPILFLSDTTRYYEEKSYRQLLHFYSDNNSCLRKSVWNEIPYPDVNYAEDQLWAKKIIENGYKKAYAQDAIVYHSHDYTPFETLMRSFDESRAFHKYFNYKLCDSLSDIKKYAISHIYSDFTFSKYNEIPFKGFKAKTEH